MNILLKDLFDFRQLVFVPTSAPEDVRWPEYLGIELELENVLYAPRMLGWTTHSDNSLRNGIEFVLASPAAGGRLADFLDSYFSADIRHTSGPRTSTHIHLNMTNANYEELRSMLALMYFLETPLYNVIGESRKWGGYSMALSEMPRSKLADLMSANSPVSLSLALRTARNQDRYYGFNVLSMSRHGTAEFRYFPGGPSRDELESWMDFVVAIKQASQKYSLESMIDRLTSPEAVRTFVAEIMPETWIAPLLQAATPEQMYDDFNSIAALAGNPEEIKRRDQLVFLTPSLLKYVGTRLVKSEQGRTYLNRVQSDLKVISTNEWLSHLRQARNHNVEEEVAIIQSNVDWTSVTEFALPNIQRRMQEMLSDSTAPPPLTTRRNSRLGQQF